MPGEKDSKVGRQAENTVETRKTVAELRPNPIISACNVCFIMHLSDAFQEMIIAIKSRVTGKLKLVGALLFNFSFVATPPLRTRPWVRGFCSVFRTKVYVL